MKPLILKVDAKGNPIVTTEEIQNMVELAYSEGFKDGSKGSSITYMPSVTPTWPPAKWNEVSTTPLDQPWYKTVITCDTKGDANAR